MQIKNCSRVRVNLLLGEFSLNFRRKVSKMFYPIIIVVIHLSVVKVVEIHGRLWTGAHEEEVVVLQL